MKVGDVVLYTKLRWKVLSHSSEFRVYTLARPGGIKIEAPDDAEALEDLVVLFNPGESWPFVVVPNSSKNGPLIGIFRGTTELTIMEDWVPSDFIRSGGSVFFLPALRLRLGETLSGVHQSGARSRINITMGFGLAKNRKARQLKPAKPKGIPSPLDRIMYSDFEDD